MKEVAHLRFASCHAVGFVVGIAAAALAGCKQPSAAAPPEPDTVERREPPAPAPVSEPAQTACEALVSRWHACIDKSTPPAAREAEKAAVDETFARWTSEAMDDGRMIELENDCNDALEDIGADCRPRDEGRATVLGAQPFGILACDEYVRKYAVCINEKLPESVRAVSTQVLRESLVAWHEAARVPAGPEGLAQACKTAYEALQNACNWPSLDERE